MGLVQEAWQWMDAAQLSYWDALILAAADRSNSRHLLSEDFQSVRLYWAVRVLNPFAHAPSEFLPLAKPN
jgi:predicted nucleic acid-binding protein